MGKTKKYRDAPIGMARGVLAGIADQPQLVATSIGTIAIGLIARRPQLIRGGARMLAVHLAATTTKAAVRRSPSETASERGYLSDLVVGAAVGWLAEALVSAAFDRVIAGDEEAA